MLPCFFNILIAVIDHRIVTIVNKLSLKLFTINLKHLKKEEISKAFYFLDNYEKTKASQYKNIESKNTFIMCRAYAKKLLSKHIAKKPESISFDYTKDGKPYLHNHPINFNISHSNDFGLIGISTQPIGVDIEKIDKTRNWQCIAESIFSKNEIQWLKENLSAKNFYLLTSVRD